MQFNSLKDWLLEGDVSIQYQVHRDLLGLERSDLKKRIASEGWGAAFLKYRQKKGHWGKGFYQPKWISSHYTLLDLKNLGVSEQHPLLIESVDFILREEKSPDGGIGPFGDRHLSDVCVNGMFLNYSSYFKTAQQDLESIVDFILSQRMADGGCNCRSNRSGANHSSLHSTLSVLEGIHQYLLSGYKYRENELRKMKQSGEEFILLHQLFRSDKTGEVINKEFLKFRFPCRWHYDILRALDYFAMSRAIWDDRLIPAIKQLLKKKRKNGSWNLNAHYPGKFHFQMELAGKPSRWNTLRALRVLKYFEIDMKF